MKLNPDLPAVLRIERSSFPTPWRTIDFLYQTRQRNHLAYVAEDREEVVGYAVGALKGESFHLLNFAVDPARRREGIGSQMMDFLINVARAHGCNKIYLEVREHNLPAQLFYRKLGFRATQILKKYYKDTDEDGYLMELELI